MPKLTFDRYYRYAELTEVLQDFAATYPQLCQLQSIGKSHEGRDIWLVTLTNTATGPDTDKPAFWVDGNIHATEVSPSSCALYAINKILTGYGNDASDNADITRLLDTRTLYVVPRFNPDGAELFLDERHKRIRSSVRPYPRREQQDGLIEQDIDGDGRVLHMRIKDPNGPWKVHPDEPRLLIPREPTEPNAAGTFYRLLDEGTIQNFDGTTIKPAPRLEGLDLNRNFPGEWTFESEQFGAGPFPTSEPEVRAVVAFIAEHPNITGAIAFHTYSGVYLRPFGGHPDDHFPAEDLWTYQEIGKHATRLTGYPAVSVHHDFKYHPKESIKGVFDDWLYNHFGIYAWTCELWSPQTQAGIDMSKKAAGTGSQYIDWFREHPVEDDVKLLKWIDENTGGQGFVNWTPFTHPQLGEVEIGGIDAELVFRNPPLHLLEKEIAKHADFILFHALISPLIAFREVTVSQMSDVGDQNRSETSDISTFKIRAVIENTGWLPTNITSRAAEKKFVLPVEAEITLPENAKLLSGDRQQKLGQLAGRALKNTHYWSTDPTHDRAKAEWVIQAKAGDSVTVTAVHPRAGKISKVVVLDTAGKEGRRKTTDG